MKDAKRWWRSTNNKQQLLSQYFGNRDHEPSEDDILEMYNEELMAVEY